MVGEAAAVKADLADVLYLDNHSGEVGAVSGLLGKRDVLRDAVTSAEFFNHHLYLITYNRLIIYSLKKGLPVFKKQIPLFPITQKEALAVNKNGLVYLADERNKLLGGGLIYTVNTYNK
jgi:hypothetical protein